MQVLEIFKGSAFQVVAEGSNDQCEVLEFLIDKIPKPPVAGEKKKKGQYGAAARGLLALIQLYSNEGRAGVNNSDLFHEADKATNLWEFIKGDLRVYCRIDKEGRLVLLTGALIKKGNKTESSVKSKGDQLYKRYEKARKDKSLIVNVRPRQR